MRYSKPEFFYHITNSKWAKRKKLYPRKDGPHRDIEEPAVSRICVSKTVYGCVSAVAPCLGFYRDIFIYRTLRRVKAVYTYDVIDSRITQERWLLKPTVFIRVGVISHEKLREIYDGRSNSSGDPDCLDEQKQMLDVVIKPFLRPLVEAL